MFKENFKLRGSIVAIVTPFKSDKSIDYKSLEKLIDFQIDNKTDAIVMCGTTGEAVTLTDWEYAEIISFAFKKINKRVPMIVGTGSNSTYKTVGQSITAIENGADAILVVSPYYNKPMPDGIYRHYAEISKNSKKPIILYNVPGRTGKAIPVETIIKLANDFDNIVAIKEAGGDLNVIMDLVQKRPANFKIYSGDDNLAFPSIILGSDGCISVAANVFPEDFSLMINSSLKFDIKTASELHYKYLRLMNLNFIESSPMPVKTILAMMGMIEEEFRLPMYKMENQANRDILRNEITKLGFI
jgi:4-hydroxy-tetrahydrodipicolinate synthase